MQNMQDLALQVWVQAYKATAISPDIPARRLPSTLPRTAGLAGTRPVTEPGAADFRGFQELQFHWPKDLVSS